MGMAPRLVWRQYPRLVLGNKEGQALDLQQRRKYLSHRLKPAFCLCVVPCAVLAQTPPPAPPTAGSLLQQMQPLTKPPTADTPAPEVKLPKAVSAPTQGGPRLQVKEFRLAGLEAPQLAAVLPLLQKYLGPDKTLADLEDAAKDVEVALQRSGFFLAQAYVPEQTIVDGVVTLQVLIGRLGAIKLEIEPGVKVSPDLMDQIVARLRGNPVAERELIERALFTLGDLRGIAISSSLTPGERSGRPTSRSRSRIARTWPTTWSSTTAARSSPGATASTPASTGSARPAAATSRR